MGTVLIKLAAPLLGLLFLVSGLAKAGAIGEFSLALLREVPIPREAGAIAAFLLIAAEVLSGAGLFFRRTRRLSAVTILFLLFLFLIILLRNTINGDEVACNCFGLLAVRIPALHHLVMNITLAFIALLIARRAGASQSYAFSRRLPPAFLIVAVIGLLVLIWGVVSAFRSVQPASPPEGKKLHVSMAFPVKVSTARRATLVQAISSSGLLRPCRIVEVLPRVSGQVMAAGGYEGKDVSRGEVLAAIDDVEFRLAYERASTALLGAQIEYRTLSASPFLQTIDTMRARLDLEAAREYYQRVRTAYAAGRIDGSALYRARRAYDATRAYFSANREDVIENRSGLAFAREAYERAKRELEATQVRAPIEGRIASWNIAVGMYARPGQSLCSVVDMSKILIDADIVEGEAAKVHTGSHADISCLALPGIRFSGIVRAVSPVIDAQTRMMRATVELFRQSASRPVGRTLLRHGMFATVMIETDRLEGRLLVPREALLVRDLRQLVFTVENGLANWHYVETGQENREFVEIRSGLCEGDTVIVDGHHALAHDARVYIKD